MFNKKKQNPVVGFFIKPKQQKSQKKQLLLAVGATVVFAAIAGALNKERDPS